MYCFSQFLFHIDAEGDLIAFSSDEELVEALGQLSEEVFRIYISSKNRLLSLLT